MAAIPVILLLASLAATARGGVLLSSLNQSIEVYYSIDGVPVTNGGSMYYNQGELEIRWQLNSSFADAASSYKQAAIQLCFGAPSSSGRSWRASNNDLSKSKNCQTMIAKQPYLGPGGNRTLWTANINTPGAVYFVRVTMLNSTASNATVASNAVAYGQTTNANMTANLVTVIPYAGTTWYLDLIVILVSVSFVTFMGGYLFWEHQVKKNK
jgi:hypothetical protein